MIFVGIDIAKKKHFAAAMNSDGQIIFEPFPFDKILNIDYFLHHYFFLIFLDTFFQY